MTAERIYDARGNQLAPAVCGKCNRIWESVESAERCCTCSFCGFYHDWHKGVSHEECSRKWAAESESSAMAAAIEVEPDGPIMYDERIFGELEEAMEYISDRYGTEPEFIFATEYRPPFLDAESVIDSIADEMHEDWEPEFVPELQEALEKWNTANANNGSYYEDRTKKYRLRWTA